MGTQKFGIHFDTCLQIANAIKELHDKGVEIGIVVGAGNIFRGINSSAYGMERAVADHVGMVSTIINGIVLQQILSNVGCETRVLSAIESSEMVEPFSWDKAHSYLQNKTIVIFVGGTGNPFFTTDTAAALRANEIRAEILLKATKVDGIYDKDPIKHPDAVKYDCVTYSQALKEKLRIMDSTAFALCMENNIPIRVFNINSITKAVYEKDFGTLVKEEKAHESQRTSTK